MLTAILAVTLVVNDIETASDAYQRHLSYQVVERGELEPDLAEAWGAPLAARSAYAILQPKSGAQTYLRLIERPPTEGYQVMRSYGWNSNEILVEDPVALTEQFRRDHAPFEIIGEPKPLASSPAVIAMQAIGPAGELNYFTRIPPGGGTFIKTSAQSFVDRSFIVVLGGPSMSAMQQFYRDILGAPVTDSYMTTVSVLQRAYDLPPNHPTRLALVNFSDGFLIELDEYPEAATPRPQRAGDLPPAMAMVSFCADFSGLSSERELPWRQAPTARRGDLYQGRRAGVLLGAAGEWIELVDCTER